MTLEDLLPAFEEAHVHARQGSRATVASYASDVRLYHAYLMETSTPTDLTSLSEEILRAYLRWLQDKGRWSRATIQRRMYGVLAIARYAYTRRLIPEDLRQRVMLPRRQLARRKTIPSWEDVRRFVQGSVARLDGDFARASLTAGILLVGLLAVRRAECLALTWDDALHGSAVHVVGKGDKDRLLPLAPVLREALCACRAVMAPQGDASNSARVCQSALRRPLSPTTFNLGFRQAWTSVGCPGVVTPHTLRHAVATTLLDRGATLAEVAAILGHSPLGFGVTGIYLHAAERRLAALLAELSCHALGDLCSPGARRPIVTDANLAPPPQP